MKEQRIECRITGRVQMVMFRDFAQRKARKLGLLGFTRNEPDGSVTVVAEGAEDSLKEYLRLLATGPILARVDNVEVEWKDKIEEYKDFEIRY